MSKETRDSILTVIGGLLVILGLIAFFAFVDQIDEANAARVWSAECDNKPAVLVSHLRTGLSSFSGVRVEDGAEISGGIQGCVFVRQLDD